MTVEAAGFIDDIDPTQPPGTDNFSEGDDHLRNFKKSVQDSFPNISGAMTATHTELNTVDGYTGNTADLNVLSGADAGGLTAAELLYVAGVTSDIQTQIDAKMTGSNNLSDVTDSFVSRANLELDTIGADHQYLGTGDLGPVTMATDTTLDSGEYHYTDLTINGSQTLDVTESTNGFLIIRCTGTCTITALATIDLDGKGSAGGVSVSANSGNGNAGAAGTGGASGGSGGSANDGDAGAGGDNTFRGVTITGPAGPTSNNINGNAGSSMDAKFTRVLNYIIDPLNYTGSGGGSGGSPIIGVASGTGGNGGGVLMIIADTIDFQSTATITLDGAAGSVPTGAAGAGGGGGGGTLVLVSNTLTNAGTITVTGGAGGVGGTGGDGGAGGVGTTKIITL